MEPSLYIVLAKWPLFPKVWWAHPDLNQGPSGYEPVALTAELRALDERAGNGARTRVAGLEGQGFTTKLCPRNKQFIL